MTVQLAIHNNQDDMFWYRNNVNHNKFGPAIIALTGSNLWWVECGLIHRLDGPAIEYFDGHKEWYVSGKLHRLDGPAIICSTGTKQWYVNDIEYKTHLEYLVAVEQYKLNNKENV